MLAICVIILEMTDSLVNNSMAINNHKLIGDYWTLALNDKASVATVYIDYSKAFDVVCHSKLLYKLSVYGISGNLLSWIQDFLHERSQVTRVGDHTRKLYISTA